ncbi:MAG: glycosyltransferase family 39 protein [Bryobacteraceae bacterium]
MRKQIPRAALTLLGMLLAVNAYRAATQSITIDEAYNYNLYLTGPLKEIFNLYDANNHVLYTLLARASVHLFGPSEMALRLPSVLGGALFFATLFGLCRRLFGDGWVMLLAVAVVSLNPYVLDFLSAARGYGLALGLLFAGLVALSDGSLWTAGVAFGLSVAANLTMAFPVTAAVFLFGARFLRERRFVDELLLPAVVVAGLCLAIPLSNARPDQFYYGAKSLLETSESLVYGAFIHRPDGGFLGDMERFAPEARFLAHRVAPVVTVMLAIGALIWRERIAATFVVTLALLIAAHAAAGVLYPLGRTGLHLLILALLGVVALVPLLWRRRATRPLAAIPAAVALLATVVFMARWNVRVYGDWTFNSATREIVETIAADRARRGLAAVTVGGSWLFEPGLNYYRHARKLEWMKPVVRGDAAGAFDYYVLMPEDKAVVERRSLRALFTDSRSGVVLATRYTEQTAHENIRRKDQTP